MRWADLDSLGHINNVVYVDYLQEARVDMFRLHNPAARAPELGEGLVVARHEITYLLPLHYRQGSVSIECWVTEIRAASFTMAYEIFDETDAGRVVYLRASTVLTPFLFAEERPRRLRLDEKAVLQKFLEPTPARPRTVTGAGIGTHELDYEWKIPVRFSDVDVYGHVNNVEYLTYLQEARISMMADLAHRAGGAYNVVVAQTDIDYRRPLVLSGHEYSAWTRLERLGTKSVTLTTDILDSEGVLHARGVVVMVFFDIEAERAIAPSGELRQAMLDLMVTPGAQTLRGC